MNQLTTVFFTGMEALDAEQLTALFQETNRRTGNRWSLAEAMDSADVLVIDVDTLYGHMTWLRSQNTEQTIVALTTGESAEADFVLHRPVTLDAMRRLLHELPTRPGNGSEAGPALPAQARAAITRPPPPMAAPVQPPRPVEPAPASAPEPAPVAPAGTTAAEPVEPAASPAAPVESITEARPAAPRRLRDALPALSGRSGRWLLELPGLPPLALDLEQGSFLCGGGIKAFLPHTQAELDGHGFEPLGAAEFKSLEQQIGGSQPLVRLQWLAALGGNGGEAPGDTPDARYRLSKWPQIEREFSRHFRIATSMMKGFQTPAELAEASGAQVADVNDFIAASLASGYAEAEASAGNEETPATPGRGLLDRLRRGRN